jgi:Na+/H+-dicarboxylate symporter
MQFSQSRGQKLAALVAVPALILGFALGAIGHGQGGAWLRGAEILGPIGGLWTNALQVTVIPLVVSLLVSGIGGMPTGRAFGRWGWTSLAVFAGLLVFAAALTVSICSVYLPAFGPARLAVPVQSSSELPGSSTLTFANFVEGLIPPNLIDAAAKGQMLPLVIVSVLFALAIRTLEDSRRAKLIEIFESIRDALLTYIRWILLAMPVGAFALAYAFAAESGWSAASAAGHYFAFETGCLLAVTAALYVVVLLVGRASPLRFARAVFPAQAVAISTRSSVASLPATVQGARHMELPDPAGSLVLPLAVSVFKQNRTVSSTAKLLFLGTLFGVALSPADVVAFVLTIMLISVSNPGIPRVGTHGSFGAYVAAGIPPAGYMLFEAVEPLIDVFKTLLNVTGNLCAAVLVSKAAASTNAIETLTVAGPESS